MRIKDIKSIEDYKKYMSGTVPIEPKNKSKFLFNKKIFVPVITGVTATVMLITMGACSIFRKNKKNKTNNEPTTSYVVPKPTSLDSLGTELPQTSTENKEYRPAKNSTGVADPNKVVQGSNGKYYVDQTAKNNSNKTGTKLNIPEGTKIENGKVVEEDTSYKVNGSDGKIEEGKINPNAPTTSTGDQVPNDDYVIYDDEIIEKEDEELAKNSVTLTYDIYDIEGNVVYSKGDTVNKKSLEDGIANGILFTTKPVINNQNTTTEVIIPETKPESTPLPETKPETTPTPETTPEPTPVPTPENSTSNETGYYSAYDLKFESEAVFNDWLEAGGEGFYRDETGIIRVYEAPKVKTLTK